MGYIRLTNVTFSPAPSGDVTVTVKYRLTSDPDVPGSYTTVTTTATVNSSGVFTPTVSIGGLTDGVSYTVVVTPNCGGAGASGTVTAGTTTTTTTTTVDPTGDPYNESAYTVHSGAITGTCNLASSYITRTASAASAATSSITVQVDWSADSGCTYSGVAYTFDPGATESTHEIVDLSCSGSCSSAEGTIMVIS